MLGNCLKNCWKTVGSLSAPCENCWKTVGKILAPWCLEPRGFRHHGAKIFPTVFQQFHSVPIGFQQFSNSLALQQSCTPTLLAMSHAVLVVNENGYWGEGTASNICYARIRGCCGCLEVQLGSGLVPLRSAEFQAPVGPVMSGASTTSTVSHPLKKRRKSSWCPTGAQLSRTERTKMASEVC